jgi:hypothetical protein
MDWTKDQPYKMPSLWLFYRVACYIDWTKVQPYIIGRAYSSNMQRINPIGMMHFVATDFNPLDVAC